MKIPLDRIPLDPQVGLHRVIREREEIYAAIETATRLTGGCHANPDCFVVNRYRVIGLCLCGDCTRFGALWQRYFEIHAKCVTRFKLIEEYKRQCLGKKIESMNAKRSAIKPS